MDKKLFSVSNLIKTAAAFALLGVLFAGSCRVFMDSRIQFPIYPGGGLTKIVKLGDYFEKIRGTEADTDVYLFDSGAPGGAVLILGGTHNDEPSGHVAAVALIENIRVTSGRVFIAPRANQSGMTHTTPLEGFLDRYFVDTPQGRRWFKFGSRYTNPVCQWPDPDIFVHHPSGQNMAGEESRNLNRSWPGRPDGTYTEKLAYAYMQLIEKEKIDVAVDLHEAPLEYFLINAICYPAKSGKVAMGAEFNLSMEDLQYTMEASPPNLRGFFHREVGDFSRALPFLMETANPSQGRFHGLTTNDLIVKGQDGNYVKAGKLGRLFVDMDEKGWPLSLRVARQIKGIQEIVNAFNDVHPELAVAIKDIPEYSEIVEKGVGSFLKGPQPGKN
jgi:hypothetical protein